MEARVFFFFLIVFLQGIIGDTLNSTGSRSLESLKRMLLGMMAEWHVESLQIGEDTGNRKLRNKSAASCLIHTLC